jgi:hypothetical protein
MAKNMIYKYTENKTRDRVLDSAVDSGTPVLDPDDARPAVTITAVGQGISKTLSVNDNPQQVPFGGGVTSITYTERPASLEGLEATLAYDGTWQFDVVSTGTTPAPTSTENGVQVYITGAGALTLASSGNTAYGHVDYPTDWNKVAGKLPVRIGA